MTTNPTTSAAKQLAARKSELAHTPPTHPHSDLHFWKSTLIFAPHPDDESLGCGGLIALLTGRGQEVRIVFVSDGAMSHPNSRRYDREARVALREMEATRACAELGVGKEYVTFLRYRDTEVPRENSTGFAAAVAEVRGLIEQLAPSHILAPWRRDPHCDHRGTWEICRAAVGELATKPRWVEYPIWMWNSSKLAELPLPGEVTAWRLDVSEQLDRKWRAIDLHVSQRTRLIDDDPEGFVLEESMLDNFRRGTELYFEDGDKKHRTLSEDYFDQVYAKNPDPWSFETSPYERDKYQHTIASLPKKRYHSAFEIGCSIGILTQLLSPYCQELLAIDASASPLERARKRLSDNMGVTLRQLEIPHQFPDQKFDLIILSEVGYYLSVEDLGTAIKKIGDALQPGGDLVLVHYTPYVPDYPLAGDEVHEAFATKLPRGFKRLRTERADRYRLDVFRKSGS